MKFSRSRLWIIILGGVIGLALCAAIPYFLIDPNPHWKHLIYNAIAPETDRAAKLVSYDSSDGTLFIKSQSQTIYGCPAEPYREPSDCHLATPETLAKRYECSGRVIQQSDDPPPGKVISKMTVFDCRYNEYWTVQTSYAILDDGSLWQLTHNDFDLATPFRNFLVVVGAIMGISIGIGIGAAIPRMTLRDPRKHQPRSSA